MLDYIFRKYILATEAVKTRVQNHDIVMCAPRWNSIESRCVLLMMMMCLTQGRMVLCLMYVCEVLLFCQWKEGPNL